MNADTPWRECQLAVVDVETTGLDPAVDRVIEIAIIHMRQGEVVESWSTLVNPEQELPEEVIKITGIEPADLAGAPRFAEVAEEVYRRLEGRILVAYNLAFDRAFIAEELKRDGRELPADLLVIDPLVFVRELHRSEGSKRLGAVAERLGIELTNAHRAKDDAEVAGLVLYALGQQLPPLLGDLRLLQEQWEIQQRNEMATWRNRRGGAIDTAVSTGDLGAERGNALGPAYIYGDDTDPIRAMFTHLPDSGARR